MRKMEILIFLVIALSLYSSVNFYVIKRGCQALRGCPDLRRAFLVLMIILALCYPAGRLAAAAGAESLAVVLVRMGSFYLAAWFYLFLAVLVIDTVRLANAFLGFFPRILSASPEKTGLVLFLVALTAVAATVLGGAYNSAHPRMRTLDIRIDKPAAGRSGLKAVLASDIHMGTMASLSSVKRIVDLINGLQPDIIFLPGDIVDESVSRGEEEGLVTVLRSLRAPLGVFSVTGNHEVYSGLEKNLDYLRRGGVRVLQDEAVVVSGAFGLIGRQDPSALGPGRARTTIGAIMEAGAIDSGLPLILLDHQPLRLREAEEAGIDLQLSGHTHAGQLFPLNLINKAVWEKNWGYLVKGRTQYYVSCGVGTWGPRVRTGSVPEVVEIRISFSPAPQD